MKLVIASDIHGSAKYCRNLVEAFVNEGADKLLLLGDILYHGPRNPLPEEYSPQEVLSLLSELKHKIICVRGNCDAEIDCELLPFPVPDYAYLSVDGLNIYMSHGHRAAPPLKCGDVYLTGHTHVPLYENGEYVHLNPGSVSLPKEYSRHGYILYENRKFIFKDLNGEIYGVADLSDEQLEIEQPEQVEEEQLEIEQTEQVQEEQLEIEQPEQVQEEQLELEQTEQVQEEQLELEQTEQVQVEQPEVEHYTAEQSEAEQPAVEPVYNYQPDPVQYTAEQPVAEQPADEPVYNYQPDPVQYTVEQPVAEQPAVEPVYNYQPDPVQYTVEQPVAEQPEQPVQSVQPEQPQTEAAKRTTILRRRILIRKK